MSDENQINRINPFPFYSRFWREPQISPIGGILSLALVIKIPKILKICGYIFEHGKHEKNEKFRLFCEFRVQKMMF